MSQHGHGKRSFASTFMDSLCHGLPALLLLGLATACIHWLHAFDFIDGWFMREAVRSVMVEQSKGDTPLNLPPHRERLVVLEASTLMRITELEHDGRGLDQVTLDRIGGVRPIDRASMARLLQTVSDRIEALPSGRRPAVVAIDVDLAPLSTEAPSLELLDALMRLRRLADVIVIALDRPDDRSRLNRNRFMAEAARCTGGDFDTDSTVNGLYFASSRLFHRDRDYPLHFPRQSVGNGQAGTGDFSSLANLVHLLIDGSTPGGNARAALTRLCLQASQAMSAPAQSQGTILEDRLVGHGCPPNEQAGCYDVKKHHRLQRINWKLLELGPIEAHLLAPAAAAASGAATFATLDDAALDAGTLLIGIDGGARHDKFDGALPTSEWLSGARLHALQAASLIKGYELAEHYSWGFLVDLGVGLAFILAWSAIKALSERGQQSQPGAKGLIDLITALAPPALAMGLAWLSIHWLAPWLLQRHDLWVNPAYVLLGLVVHAYVEAWQAHGPHAGHGSRLSRLLEGFSFGIVGTMRAAPPWLAGVLPLVALAVCLAGIAALLGLPGGSGQPAALGAAALIGFSLIYSWVKT